ncbi:MAG: hypothetical protein KGL39_43290 [Patescibacteria group bacterium]|nr:hypothetical protein [Patescibacteria group bacterium]
MAFAAALLRTSRVQPYDHSNDKAAYSRTNQPADYNESWEALWQRTKQDPIAFFTAVLAGSTAILFVIAGGSFIKEGAVSGVGTLPDDPASVDFILRNVGEGNLSNAS